jgi:hypothetical protein
VRDGRAKSPVHKKLAVSAMPARPAERDQHHIEALHDLTMLRQRLHERVAGDDPQLLLDGVAGARTSNEIAVLEARIMSVLASLPSEAEP